MSNLFLTLLVGLAFGYVFMKLKVPGGMMVGAILGVAALNISFGISYMPPYAKYAAQILAGAFIGCSIEKSDIERLRHLIKPSFVLLLGMLTLNITLGFLIYLVSPLDLLTSLMSCIPGGMSDIPIISADMGADAPKVALLQFTRMVAGIGLFPTLITIIGHRNGLKNNTDEQDKHISPLRPAKSDNPTAIVFIQTITVATAGGIIGKLLKIPAGILLFSMIGVICLKLLFNKAYMPFWAKRLAQALSGSYIGCSIGFKDVLEMRYLILPAILVVLGYFAACCILGKVLSKHFGMSLKEAMLVATPAGASDMALISSDLGVQSTDLMVLQIIRMIVVVSLFPQIIYFIVTFIA